MQNTNDDIYLEVNCDWVTATSRNASSCSGLGAFGAYLIDEAVGRGSKRRSTRAYGYSTAVTDGVCFGRREDGCLVQVKSKTAAEHWFQTVDLADHVTRFDVQATVRPSNGPQGRLRQLWDRRNRALPTKGRVQTVKAIVGQKGIETLLVGSRASERYGRFYDKGIESMLPEYAGALRFEIELKSAVAQFYATQFAASENPEALMFEYISKFVSDRFTYQLRPAEFGASPCLLTTQASASHRETSTSQDDVFNRSVLFLNRCIRPLAQRFVKAGRSRQLLDALGLTLDSNGDLVANSEFDYSRWN